MFLPEPGGESNPAARQPGRVRVGAHAGCGFCTAQRAFICRCFAHILREWPADGAAGRAGPEWFERGFERRRRLTVFAMQGGC
jgi:hypothetical protein